LNTLGYKVAVAKDGREAVTTVAHETQPRDRRAGREPTKGIAMEVQRVSAESSLLEVLDRVLDKGIVIDAWVRLSLVGIDLVTVEARVVVASIATYLQFSEPLGVPAVDASAARAVATDELERAKQRRARLARQGWWN